MEIQQISSGISQHQNSISVCQRQISLLEEEIEELTYLQKRIQRYAMDFSDVQTIRKANVDDAIVSLCSANRYSTRVTGTIEAKLWTKLTGTEQLAARNNMANAVEKIQHQIQQKANQLDLYSQEMSNHNTQIQILKSELQELQQKNE